MHGHVTVAFVGDPVVIVAPDAFKDFQTAEIVEETTLALDLHAALSYNSAVLVVHALCAYDEEWPEKKLVHAARNTNLRDVVQALRNKVLEIVCSSRQCWVS